MTAGPGFDKVNRTHDDDSEYVQQQQPFGESATWNRGGKKQPDTNIASLTVIY